VRTFGRLPTSTPDETLALVPAAAAASADDDTAAVSRATTHAYSSDKHRATLSLSLSLSARLYYRSDCFPSCGTPPHRSEGSLYLSRNLLSSLHPWEFLPSCHAPVATFASSCSVDAINRTRTITVQTEFRITNKSSAACRLPAGEKHTNQRHARYATCLGDGRVDRGAAVCGLPVAACLHAGGRYSIPPIVNPTTKLQPPPGFASVNDLLQDSADLRLFWCASCRWPTFGTFD
jgi:hypothetical protein